MVEWLNDSLKKMSRLGDQNELEIVKAAIQIRAEKVHKLQLRSELEDAVNDPTIPSEIRDYLIETIKNIH